jgi:YHS domain-containing protein
MSALLWFALWGVAIFLMMRFGCGAHVMGHGRDGDHSAAGQPGDVPRWVPPPTDIDPVCGKTIRTDSARPTIHDGQVFYFCSRDCREMFEAAPEVYLRPQGGPGLPRLENNHV